MSSLDVASLDTLKERKRLVDDVWLLTLTILLIAIGVPWFQRILDVNLAVVGWSAFTFGCVYVALSLVADRMAHRTSFLAVAVCLHVVGILVLGMLWRATGGLQNPMFLLVFVVPVMTASLLLPRWHVYAAVFLAVVTVTLISLVDHPTLLWYVLQLGVPFESAAAWLARWPASNVRPFPELADVPSYLAVAILVFGALLFAVAAACGAIGQTVVKHDQRSAILSTALSQAQSLSLDAIRLSPWPAALIAADTGLVVQVSETFRRQFFIGDDDVAGRDFLTLLDFSYPDAVEALATGSGGTLPVAACRVGGELRLTRVEIRHLVQAEQRFAWVALLDVTETRCLKMALNSLEEPLVVIDPSGRIRVFNPAAERLLPDLEAGADATTALQASNMPFEWWKLGRRRHRHREVILAGQTYAARCVALPIEGEHDSPVAVAFCPKAGAA